MKTVIFVFVILALFCAFEYMSGQTIINNEFVSGTWTKSNSPYVINCNIIVPVNSALVIENGVKVIFSGAYDLTIEGQIFANGIKNDSIHFTSMTKWRGIKFINNTGLPSNLSYCIVEKSGDKSGEGEYMSFTNGSGGALSISGNAQIVISNCLIRKNIASAGAGIFINNSSAKIVNTIIDHNEAWHGSAIYSNKSAEYKGCIISNNIAYSGGTLDSRNGAWTGFRNCTVTKNINLGPWSGVFQIRGDLSLISTIVFENSTANCYYNNLNSDVFIKFCDIEGGAKSFTSEEVRGRLYYENNIDVPPLFFNAAHNDFRLIASLCVNHGEPGYPDMDLSLDLGGDPRIYPDSENRIDIGAFEYQGEILNYPPIIYPVEEKFVLNYSKLYIPINFFDGDALDTHTIEVDSINRNIKIMVIDTLINGYTILLKPENNWKGDVYLPIRIKDNSNMNNSTYEDSVFVHVGNRFKGIIDSNLVFMDTIKIIDDVIVTSTGNLLIKPGTYVEFQDHYKIEVLGRLNALGLEDNRITFNAVDTSYYYYNDHRIENGWAGIEFKNINNTDTLQLSYCNIYNTGVKQVNGLSFFNGTINIQNSKNILFNNCTFKSNYTFRDENNSNCGISLDSASNILIKNCIFSDIYSYSTNGAYIYADNSQLIIDNSSFLNSFCDDISQELIYNTNSKISISNSYFNNNNAFRLLYLTGSRSRSLIENCQFISNKAQVIETNIADTTIIRNNLIIKNKRAIMAGSYVIILGNIIAYNKLICNCSNFYGAGIEISGSEGLIANNTIVDNYQDSNGDAIYASYSSPTIINNILWKNRGSGIEWYNGADIGFPNPIIQNNYSLDPKFVLADSFDFNLKKSSYCIDKGMTIINKNLPDLDVYGNLRIDTVSRKIDIGAIEYQGMHILIPTSDIELNYTTTIYPNPVREYIVLGNSFDIIPYQIFNINGICVQEGMNADNVLDVSRLNDGYYILKFTMDEKFFLDRFLKQ